MTLFIVLLLIFSGEGAFYISYLLFMNCNEMWETTE